MRKNRLIILFVLVALAAVSCEEEIFGPRSLQGTWRVTENSEAFGNQNFFVGIDYVSGDSTRILIDNFGNLDGVEVTASVSGLNITIMPQRVRNYSISGNGTATSNLRRINWTYRIDSDNYEAVFEKQN
ncbi:MAG: hypothetical protein ACFCUM_18050 [Bacteroidales bacterium]